MPLTIFNLSTVDHLYIGKDTVITFAEQPVLETYNIELASEDKIKEHLAKPQNWVPQRHKTLPEIPHNTAFLFSPADVPGPRKVQLLQSAFYWFLPCLDLLPVALLFAYVFPGFLVPRCALLFWGIFVRGLHVETFVRVLRSSRCRLLIKCK